MSKIKYFLWCSWCILGAFLSPHWLILTYLNMTGLIYQYDSTMDSGTAGILGMIFLLMWLLLVLLPIVLLLKRIKQLGNKKMIGIIVIFVLSALLSISLCGWDIVAFWIK